MKINYFALSQSHHGHEYVWIFTKEELMNRMENYMPHKIAEIEELKVSDTIYLDILFPIGGSNVSATSFLNLGEGKEGIEAAKEYLLKPADGPDMADPNLVSLAEYLRTVDTEEGSCTKEILDAFDLKAEDLTQVDSRFQKLINEGLLPEHFYDEETKGLRIYEDEDKINQLIEQTRGIER